MVLAAAISPLGVRVSWADEQPPDPRMLLNLDLFAQNGNGQQGTNTSMLEQIQTLRAMGYLNGPENQPAPQPAPQPAYVYPPPPPGYINPPQMPPVYTNPAPPPGYNEDGTRE
jgi:hypothetical protein